MREVKFRGKCLDNGEWIKGDLLRMNGHWFIFPDPAPKGIDKYAVDSATVGQYTGLKDRNGKEIYEGDIFQTTDSNGYCLVVVEWDDINARFLGRDKHKNIWYVGREPAAVIIGNIHDNPELIG